MMPLNKRILYQKVIKTGKTISGILETETIFKITLSNKPTKHRFAITLIPACQYYYDGISNHYRHALFLTWLCFGIYFELRKDYI